MIIVVDYVCLNISIQKQHHRYMAPRSVVIIVDVEIQVGPLHSPHLMQMLMSEKLTLPNMHDCSCRYASYTMGSLIKILLR